MATLIGTNGDDTLTGGGDPDVIRGRGGDDVLSGDAGADRLDGGLGNDGLFAENEGESDTAAGGDGNDLVQGFGGDVLSGGAGFDQLQLNFGPRMDSLQFDLDGLLGDAERTVDVGPALMGVTLSGFEIVNLSCGSGNDQVVMGNSSGAVLGGAGDDTITGGNGHDFFRLGPGDDLLMAGRGLDRVSYFGTPGGVDVSLLLQGQAQDTNAGLDTLNGVEHVSGTVEADTLVGDGKANWIWGSGGDDNLSGGGGNDFLGAFDGDSTVAGGTGRDTLDLSGNTVTFTTGLIVNLTKQGAAQFAGEAVLTLTSIENITGSPHDDVFTGDGGANLLAGFGGADTLNGGAGADLLYGDGRVGPDGGAFGGSGPIGIWEQDPGSEGTIFGKATGPAAGDDLLLGGAGQDRLVGGLGADVLSGGKNADVFAFLSVEDSLDGVADYLLDLSNAQDVIDLAAIDADASTEADDAFVLVADLSGAAGEADLVYVIAEDVTRLLLDVDGGGADFVLEIAGNHTGFVAFIL